MTIPLFQKVDCLSIPVPDLDAALAFYSGHLGHELIWRSTKAAGLRLPGSNAELVLHTGDRSMETDLAVESVPEALARFRSAGGKLLAGPFEIEIGLCAVVSDPWDNTLVILDASRESYKWMRTSLSLKGEPLNKAIELAAVCAA